MADTVMLQVFVMFMIMLVTGIPQTHPLQVSKGTRCKTSADLNKLTVEINKTSTNALEHLDLKKQDNTVVHCSGPASTSSHQPPHCHIVNKTYSVEVLISTKGTTVIVTNPKGSSKDGHYVVQLTMKEGGRESVACNAGFVPKLNIMSIIAIVAGVIVRFKITAS